MSIIDFLLILIKASFTDDEIQTNNISEEDWDKLYKTAKYHSLTGLISYAVERSSNVPDNILQRFRKDQELNIMREANQELTVMQLLEEFEGKKIDCMPLKGFILKHLYPKVDMRNMCDVDILIHESDIDKIRPIMEAAGLRYIKESPHEFVFSSRIATVEMHKCLVAPYNKDLYAYYGDGWSVAKKKPECEHIYEMSREDFYVYTLAHLAKHYTNGGAGIKQVVDMYVLRKECTDLDYDYIDIQLDKIGIKRFHDIVCELIDVWFGDGEYSEETRTMAQFIIKSGTFGTKESSDNSLVYKGSADGDYDNVKRRIFIGAIFPPCRVIARKYTVLKKHPWLYPFVNLYRWFDVLLNRRKRIGNAVNMTHSDNEGVSEFARYCETVGLKRTL